MAERYRSPTDLAAELSVSADTIRALVRRGAVSYLRVGSAIRLLRSDVEAALRVPAMMRIAGPTVTSDDEAAVTAANNYIRSIADGGADAQRRTKKKRARRAG